MSVGKRNPKIPELRWLDLMHTVEICLTILKKSNNEKNIVGKGTVVAAAATATSQKEFECSSWTVQQVQKWADEKHLNFLLKKYDRFSLLIHDMLTHSLFKQR